MEQVILKPLLHRQQERIAIFFTHSPSLNLVVKKLPSVKWSQSNKCWYLPLNKTSFSQLTEALDNVADIDASLLKAFLEKRNKLQAVNAGYVLPGKASKPFSATAAFNLSDENSEALRKFIEQLKLKAYSHSTIQTYRNEFLQLLQLLKKKHVDDLAPNDIRRYMVYAMEKQGIKENTAHSRLNAIKFYYEQVLKRDKFFWEIPRPKKRTELPKIFNQDEIAAIINSIKNKKHKAMLMLAYSAGLRVSEVVNIKSYENRQQTDDRID
jgi:integrase/recombinase XerD